MVRIHLDTGHVVNTIESFDWILTTVELHRGGGYFSVRKRDRTMVAINCATIVMVEQIAPETKTQPNVETNPVVSPEAQPLRAAAG